MIMSDDDLVCETRNKNNVGYHALYDVAEDSELSTGVTLVALVQGVVYLFQLDETTDILNEESIPVMGGSLFEYLEDSPCEEIDYFTITNCRFPLKEELEWYSKLETV